MAIDAKFDAYVHGSAVKDLERGQLDHITPVSYTHLQRRLFKNVCANVDFYSGFVYTMLGIPKELFTPIFAIARIPGSVSYTHLFVMVTGTRTIGNVTYTFDSDGYLISSQDNDEQPDISTPTSQRTVKNYLLGALQPVGRTLYMWGGGHGWSDATRKGISTKWTSFYNSQNSSYNYKNYNDLSEANRAKGLDCSGYVGWSTYQVMQSKSGVGSGYTVVSGEIGGLYKSKGWGNIYNQNYLSNTGYKLYPGDIGYDANHTWIILGPVSYTHLVSGVNGDNFVS